MNSIQSPLSMLLDSLREKASKGDIASKLAMDEFDKQMKDPDYVMNKLGFKRLYDLSLVNYNGRIHDAIRYTLEKHALHEASKKFQTTLEEKGEADEATLNAAQEVIKYSLA